ncbi:MlrC C-terminal domain-containing protein [Nocardia panacis]|uniref:MlrC C-terminal domain-containing protein n=1 Tax=Nocardia panacis TaxID=2340916 RepID=UPI00249F60EA|nr:MlrC C-terminal domain-containing protein [Nocardia panacis]
MVIADTQDNPGAGGDARTTGMLRALLAAGESGALAAIWDPVAADPADLPWRRLPPHIRTSPNATVVELEELS